MDAKTATPRARAAWAYAGLTHPELAAATGIHKDRLRAILRVGDDRDIALDDLYAIADACGVPRSFMDHGFAGAPDEAGAVTRADLDALRAELLDQVSAIRGGAGRDR